MLAEKDGIGGHLDVLPQHQGKAVAATQFTKTGNHLERFGLGADPFIVVRTTSRTTVKHGSHDSATGLWCSLPPELVQFRCCLVTQESAVSQADEVAVKSRTVPNSRRQ